MGTLIKNCMVLCTKLRGRGWPTYKFKAKDVLIENGEIKEIKNWGVINPKPHALLDGKETHVLLPAFTDNHIHSRMVGYFGPGFPDAPVGYAPCKEKLDEAYFQAANSGTAILMDYPEYPFDSDPGKDGFHLPIECMKRNGLEGVIRILLSYDKPKDTGFWNCGKHKCLLGIDKDRIEAAEDRYPDMKFAVYIPEEIVFNSDKPEQERFIKNPKIMVEYLQELYNMDYDRLYFVMHFAEDKERVDAIRSMTPLDDQDRYDHTIDFLKENGLLRDHTVLVHCRYGMTPRVVKLIKKAKASVVVRPEKRFYNGKKSICPVKELHPKVVIGYGTDVPKFRYGMRRGYSIVSEIYYAMDIYGLSFSQSFYLATERGTQVFGFKSGRIKKGWKAHLAMLNTKQKTHCKTYSMDKLQLDLGSETITRIRI